MRISNFLASQKGKGKGYLFNEVRLGKSPPGMDGTTYFDRAHGACHYLPDYSVLADTAGNSPGLGYHQALK